MRMSTLIAAAAAATITTSAMAGSNYSFNHKSSSFGQHSKSFSFNQHDKPKFSYPKFTQNKKSHSYTQDCLPPKIQLPNDCQPFKGKLTKSKFSFSKWNDKLGKLSGWKDKWSQCERPKLPNDCEWLPPCEQPELPCDEPNPGDGCTVVPVPAAGWAGMSMLGGLALFRKLRRKRESIA